ncbi:MAG: helix-turn-helix transcriptional regulator [Acetobacteraceae bacterium]
MSEKMKHRQSSTKFGLDQIDAHVGSRVKLQRLLLSMTQVDLARSVGTTRHEIQQYESGTRRIKASLLFDLSRVFGVSVLFFFEDFLPPGQAEPPPPPWESDAPAFRSEQAPRFGPAVRLTSEETFELIVAYQRIPGDATRKCILAFIKSLAPRAGGRIGIEPAHLPATSNSFIHLADLERRT